MIKIFKKTSFKKAQRLFTASLGNQLGDQVIVLVLLRHDWGLQDETRLLHIVQVSKSARNQLGQNLSSLIECFVVTNSNLNRFKTLKSNK